MIDFLLSLAAIFGGVIGGAIGFLIIGLAAALLLLPYILINRRSQNPREREAEESLANRY